MSDLNLSFEKIMQQGINAHKSGKLKDAERFYREILETQPYHPEANHNLGMLLISINKIHPAIKLFKTAIEIHPRNKKYWFSYIRSLIKGGMIIRAQHVLKQGADRGLKGDEFDALKASVESRIKTVKSKSGPQLKNNSPLILNDKKFQQSTQKKVKEQKSKSKKPSKKDIKKLLHYYQTGDLKPAEKQALFITKKFPEFCFGWKALGEILRLTGRLSEAMIANKKVIKLNPTDAEAHNNLGATLKEIGQLDDAEASFKYALNLKPNYTNALNNLGITLQEAGNMKESETCFNKVLSLEPSFAAAHANLARLLTELSRFDEAEKSFLRTIALEPKNAISHSNFGNMLFEQGRLEEAESSLKKAISLSPNFAGAHNNLGNLLLKLGRLDNAEEEFLISIKLEPKFAEAHNNLGRVFQEQGRMKEAKECYIQAITLDKNYSQAQSNLGIILYAEGNIELAIEKIEHAISIKKKPHYQVYLSVLRSKLKNKYNETHYALSHKGNREFSTPENVLKLNRPVERELIAHLHEMESLDLNNRDDPSFGNARGSDYHLFTDQHPLIRNLEYDFRRIIKRCLNTDIFIENSFYSIFGAGGGTGKHNHVHPRDNDLILKLADQKYSLVYYLSVGDQECEEPGFLKLYDPDYSILPSNGLLVIFPASRYHSSVYGGKRDRVIVGINFYAL